MGTGKYSDKLGKGAVTSHKEPRQAERGRRETTTPLLNGRLPPKRKLLQWKPSLAIKSDKKTLMTPNGDHIPKEDRGEGTRWKAPLTTRPKKRNPGGRISTNPGEGRTAGRANASRSPQRQPEAVEPHDDQKQIQPREGKQWPECGLRKNPDRTRDR